MQTIKIKKIINVDQLPYPGVVINYDLIGRVQDYYFNYKSVRVTYNVTWVGETNQLLALTQTITDQP